MAAAKVYLVLISVIAALTLHYLGGMYSLANNEGNSLVVSELLQQRTKLKEEIALLQHVVEQLKQVDISDLGQSQVSKDRTSLPVTVSQGIPSSWQTPPIPPRTVPLIAPSSLMTTSSLSKNVQTIKAPSAIVPIIPKKEMAKTAPNVVDNGNPLILYEGEKVSSSWRDFPCALRNFKKAQVTKTCEIDCGDTKCDRAIKVCQGYVECHGIIIKGARRGNSLSNAIAVLKSDSDQSRDHSLQLLESSSWWQTNALTMTIKPRHYIVNSYGGCGSKMMAGWLSQLPSMHKKSANHYHDPQPPQQLHSIGNKIGGNPSMKGSKNDYRSGRFPGGSKFKDDTELVDSSHIDDYRVIFIYKDPVEALVSRYGYGHCMHIMGDCGKSEASWPKLNVYAAQQVDRMKLMPHFDSYMNPKTKRNYPIIAINYHRIWDNLPALMTALGLPQSLIKTFPPRTETVRNDATGAAEGNKAHTESTRTDLKKIYEPLIEKVMKNPAVLIV